MLELFCNHPAIVIARLDRAIHPEIDGLMDYPVMPGNDMFFTFTKTGK
ncbi:MAG: hypothetical protein HQK83_02720 [Fibrobacteria bacterium]|nr:hypothetical protein [Fibrobacteria bacterium]